MVKNMEKAVGYLRVSQADENIENQKMKIQDFAKKKGFMIAGFFADIDVSGTIPPRERPQYKMMLEFCKLNGIKTIIFYDLSRMSRSMEEGLNELKRLVEDGLNFYFAGMDFLNYDLDPMFKKKIIADFLWFAELYVSDIRKRTKIALERLQREGKIYHRPTLLHYVALYITGKEKFNQLTQEDLEKAKEHIRTALQRYVNLGLSYYKLHKQFLDIFYDLYRKYENAPRNYVTVMKLLEEVFGAKKKMKTKVKK